MEEQRRGYRIQTNTQARQTNTPVVIIHKLLKYTCISDSSSLPSLFPTTKNSRRPLIHPPPLLNTNIIDDARTHGVAEGLVERGVCVGVSVEREAVCGFFEVFGAALGQRYNPIDIRHMRGMRDGRGRDVRLDPVDASIFSSWGGMSAAPRLLEPPPVKAAFSSCGGTSEFIG